MQQVASEGCYALPKHVRGALVVPQGEVDRAQHAVCSRLLENIATGRGMDKGPLAILAGRITVTYTPVIVSQGVGEPPQQSAIVQIPGECCGLAEVVEAALAVSEPQEHPVQNEAEFDALREEVTLDRETPGRHE